MGSGLCHRVESSGREGGEVPEEMKGGGLRQQRGRLWTRRQKSRPNEMENVELFIVSGATAGLKY